MNMWTSAVWNLTYHNDPSSSGEDAPVLPGPHDSDGPERTIASPENG